MNDDLVLLESFPTPHQAHLAASSLRAVDIPVRIVDESAVSALPHLELALGGVKLFVHPEDLEDAIRILRGDSDLAEQPYREPGDRDTLAELEDEDDLLPPDDVRVADDNAFRAFRAAVVGAVLCPVLLHAYSLSLLLQLPARGAGLSKEAVKRARWAWMINAVVFLLALLGLLRFLGVG